MIVPLVLVVTIGFLSVFVLYVLVRAEYADRRTMDRESAERVARRDTRSDDRE